MGSVIVVASSKGGCSKTTTVTALAVNLATHGHKVAVCDSDPNQAFMRWYKTGEAPTLSVRTQVDHNEIVGHLLRLGKKHDVVLCDTGGWSNQTQVFAMGAADLVLIPVMPDRNSVVEAIRTAQQVRSVSEIARRDILYRVPMTRWNPKGISERAAIEDLDTSRLPRLENHIGDLVAFQKSSFSGVMPSKGYIGAVVTRVIGELQSLGAIGSIEDAAA